MNYYITYLDKNYLQHGEKLFELLNTYSKYKIIVKDRFEYSEIDIIFEKNMELNREFLLRELLND